MGWTHRPDWKEKKYIQNIAIETCNEVAVLEDR